MVDVVENAVPGCPINTLPMRGRDPILSHKPVEEDRLHLHRSPIRQTGEARSIHVHHIEPASGRRSHRYRFHVLVDCPTLSRQAKLGTVNTGGVASRQYDGAIHFVTVLILEYPPRAFRVLREKILLFLCQPLLLAARPIARLPHQERGPVGIKFHSWLRSLLHVGGRRREQHPAPQNAYDNGNKDPAGPVSRRDHKLWLRLFRDWLRGGNVSFAHTNSSVRQAAAARRRVTRGPRAVSASFGICGGTESSTATR